MIAGYEIKYTIAGSNDIFSNDYLDTTFTCWSNDAVQAMTELESVASKYGKRLIMVLFWSGFDNLIAF